MFIIELVKDDIYMAIGRSKVVVVGTGAVGAAGTVGMMTFADGTDKHPSAEVTV